MNTRERLGIIRRPAAAPGADKARRNDRKEEPCADLHP
jgi:hypothetical protein